MAGSLFASYLCSGHWCKQLLELAAVIHFDHDVGATDELPFDVELGNGWPIAVFLDTLANGLVFQHIDSVQSVKIGSGRLE